jgi:hypothetical protein
VRESYGRRVLNPVQKQLSLKQKIAECKMRPDEHINQMIASAEDVRRERITGTHITRAQTARILSKLKPKAVLKPEK